MQIGSHPPVGDTWTSRYGEPVHLGDDVGLFLNVKATVVGSDELGQPVVQQHHVGHNGGPRHSIDADDIMAVVLCRKPDEPTAHGPKTSRHGQGHACPFPGCSTGGEPHAA